MEKFKLISPFNPAGDQPKAIKKLIDSIRSGQQNNALLGVTGSGKTFTMANVIAKLNRPSLIISPNKVLAAQLYGEFKTFFPENHVEYFISYYDYYQPEAYIPQTDTYIEKDASINQQIDRLRLKATSSILNFTDTIVVASVSCIYNIGSPEDFSSSVLFLKCGDRVERKTLTEKLSSLRYERNEVDFSRGKFRIRGNILDIFPSDEETFLRITFSDIIEDISQMDPLNISKIKSMESASVYPATHFVSSRESLEKALVSIEAELKERVAWFKERGQEVFAQRLSQRTLYDMELLRQAGFCHGIENYSMHLTGRPRGQRPLCLLDYFPKNFLLFIDESHVTVPQIRGMYEGDKSRKNTLVEFGFRLPSALENRPLKYEEFDAIRPKTIFVSATLSPYEVKLAADNIAEQIIRPTGLADPEVEILPLKNQIKELISRIEKISAKKERTLVLTLTKKNARDLSDYLSSKGIKTAYMHSDMDNMERIEILDKFRKGEYDVLVGINLLREGLDIPQISLVAILNADNEGFLRSETTLIQIAGRAARNKCGKVLLFADFITNSIKNACAIMKKRREIQLEYNEKHGIKPKTIEKAFASYEELKRQQEIKSVDELEKALLPGGNIESLIEKLRQNMIEAAENLEFEKAAIYRDKIKMIEEMRSKHGENNVKRKTKEKNKRGS